MFKNIKAQIAYKRNRQKGLVSIIVATNIVIILALLVIGFSIIMRRELRQTLDQELASQANYSAESGFNDAKTYVTAQLAAGKDPSTGNNCLDVNSSTPPFVQNGSVSGDYNKDVNDKNIKYSCIIIDSRPYDLTYDIKAGSSVVFKIIPLSDTGGLAALSSLYFSWENKDNASITPLPLPGSNTATHRLPKEDEYNDTSKCSNDLSCTGLLEVTIYPIFDINKIDYTDRDKNQDAVVAQNSRTYFLYSNGGDGSVGTAPYSSNGQFINGNCNNINHPTLPYNRSNPRYCNTAINNLPNDAVNGAKFYYVRVRSLYTTQSVSIQASDSSNTAAKLGGAQVSIDVTGSGNNILKRMTGRLPLSKNILPEYAVQSLDSICKRFKIPLGINPTDYLPAVVEDSAGNVDGACNP